MVKLVFLLMPAVALAYEYGPDPRYTAAPGDHPMACASAGCHTSNSNGGPINAGGGGVTATFSSGSSYTPGGPAITITVSVSDPTNTGYGFQMTARLDSDQTNGQAGDFTAGMNQIVLCDSGSPKMSGKACPATSPVEFIEHDYPTGTAVKNTSPYTFTWTPPATNVGPVHFYVAGNAVTGKLPLTASGADRVYTASYVLTPAGSTTAPVLTSGSVANGATYVAGGLVPGSWAQVKGAVLSSVTRIWASADFNGLGNNLPTNLSGVQVMVNNLPAAVYYIDAGQVSFQVPDGVSGTASVQVINDGAVSNTVTGAAVNNSPGIFPIIVNGTNYPAAVFASDNPPMFAGDPSAGSAFRKAKPGEVVQLYATGLAVTKAGVVPGPPQGISGVTVTVGSATVNADFAGLVAVGEFQINFKVPNLPGGSYPISITVGGVSSPATIDSNPPGPIMLPIGP